MEYVGKSLPSPLKIPCRRLTVRSAFGSSLESADGLALATRPQCGRSCGFVQGRSRRRTLPPGGGFLLRRSGGLISDDAAWFAHDRVVAVDLARNS
jgi:hypothetical protein